MRERERLTEENRNLKRALSAACSTLRLLQYGNAEAEDARRQAEMGERVLAGCPPEAATENQVPSAGELGVQISRPDFGRRTEISEGRP